MVYRLVIQEHQKKDQQITFLPEQKHYLYTVLRLKSGDRLIVMNGKGNSWLVELMANTAHVIETISDNNELPINLTLMVALPKGSGFEDIIRCCTELGVNRFIPVISERTLLKPNKNKIERWRKIAIESAEQSERQFVPEISSPMPFNDAIKQLNFTIEGSLKSNCYFCVARGERPTLWSLIKTESLPNNIILATGCEGGWTEAEINQAMDAGFQLVSLGKRILRAVTAPIMAISIITAISEN